MSPTLVRTAVSVLGLLVAVSGCRCGAEPAPVTTAPPPAAPAPPAASAAFTVLPGVPVWSESYAASHLGDGTNTRYWCTSRGPTFPITATLALAGPTVLAGVDLDTRVPSYEDSAINVATVEVLGPGGATLATQTIALARNDLTSLVLAAPITATHVRLTFHSNFGGAYAALAEVALRTVPGTGRPAVPTTPPAALAHTVPYTLAPNLPFWNETYAPARMQDATPTTYWCTSMNPTFPITATLTLASPTVVRGLLLDNRLGTYETSGIQGVTITAHGPAGDVLTTTTAMLPRNAATMVPLPMPVTTASLTVTFTSNHGGSYAGLAEMIVQ